MSSGETAKSTALGDQPDVVESASTRVEPTSDVSEVARRVTDPQHAESAASSFDASAEAAAAARDEGESHDASDALDAYARISLPGASSASASDAASSNSFLAWLKSGKSATSRALESVSDDDSAPDTSALDGIESPVSQTNAAPEEDSEPIPLRAKDSGNSLMTVVPSAEELAAVEASLDSLGVSRRPPPLAAPDANSARDREQRTSVEELTGDELVERVSVEPEPIAMTRRTGSMAPPPPLPKGVEKPPTMAPPPLPKSVAPPALTAASDAANERLEDRISLPPADPGERAVGDRISVPTLETLAGPTARVTTRPPADSDDPLAMPAVSAASAALSLVPPALPLIERTTEPPPPKRGDKKLTGLTPPPSPKVTGTSPKGPSAGGGRFFSGALGFVVGCVVTAVAMRAVTTPSTASSPSSRAALCGDPATATTAASTTTTPSLPATSPTPAEPNATSDSTERSTTPSESSAASAVTDAGLVATPTVDDTTSAGASSTSVAVASADAGAATADDSDRHHHHHHSDDPSDLAQPTGTATGSRTPTTSPANTGSTTTVASASNAATDSTDSSPAACSRRCGGNADCLIACHRTSGSSAGSTATAAPTTPRESPPVANDPPPVAAPDHATPSRDEVVESMLRIRETVLQCVDGDANNPTHANEIDVTFTFAASGRVTIALVAAPFAGTPAGSCIARAARGAHLEPFAQSSFRVTYPFRL